MSMTEVDSLMGGADRKLIDPQASSQFLFEYDGSFDMSGDMCIYFSLPDSLLIFKTAATIIRSLVSIAAPGIFQFVIASCSWIYVHKGS
jgi:hypothetical protein